MKLKAVLTIVDDVAEAACERGFDLSPEDVAAKVGNFLAMMRVHASTLDPEDAFVCCDFIDRIAEEVAKTADE